MKLVQRAPADHPEEQRRANDWRILLIIFTLAGVVESQAFGHLNAFTPLYLQQLHVPATQIPRWTGILASLGFVLGLPLLPFWGVWADRYSRKLIIVRSAYIEGVLFTIAALSPNVWVLALARFLVGFVFGNTGVMLALLADVTPRKRLGLAVGIASAGFPLGSSIGPLLGGLIAQGLGIRVLLLGDAGLSALMGIALTVIVREGRRTATSSSTVTGMLKASMRDILDTPVVLWLFVVYFIAMYGISLINPYLPILLQRLYTGPSRLLPSMIGTTLAVAGIAMGITTPIWGKVGDLAGRWRILPIALAGVAAGIAVEGLAAALGWLQAGIVGVGLFQGGIGTTIIALLALLAPEERRASILNLSLLPSQLSWFVGPITAALMTSVALRLPFAAGVVALLIATAFSAMTARLAPAAGEAEAGGSDLAAN